MKAMKKISAFAVTAFLIVFSLFLPYIFSLTIDCHPGTQTKITESNGISLSLSDNMQIIESVSWFYRPVNLNDAASVKSEATGYNQSSMVELPENSQMCRMNSGEVSAAAYEIMQEINAGGSFSGAPTEVVPKLLISSGDEVSAKMCVYWRCLWLGEEAQADAGLWIDDNSGQMVSLMMDYTEKTDSEIPEIVYTIGQYCLVHYQAEEVRCRKESEEYYYIDVTVNDNGEKAVYPILIRWQNRDLLFFNN